MAGYYAKTVFELIASEPGGLTLDEVNAALGWTRDTVRRALKSLRELKLLRRVKVSHHRYRYVARSSACPDDRRGGARARWYSAARGPTPQR